MRVAHIGVLVLGAATGCLYQGPASPAVMPDQPTYATAPDAPAPQAAPVDTGYQQSADADVAPPVPAGTDVASDDVFTEPLSPYGSWTEVDGYGRVWVPAVSYGWRPYYYGRWQLTDWGWTFVSDDPWGWAAYHYGRWNWGLGVGWYWIPGRAWGPAWVNWRYGGGYVGWCPMGPRGVVFGFGHPGWVAVGEQHFTQPIARVGLTGRATVGIVSAAQPLSGPHAVAVRGGAFGPPVAGISAATGHAITPIPATRAIATAHAAAVSPQGRATASANTSMRSPVAVSRVTAAAPSSRVQSAPASRPVARPGAAMVSRPRSAGGHAAGGHGGGAKGGGHGGGGHGGGHHK